MKPLNSNSLVILIDTNFWNYFMKQEKVSSLPCLWVFRLHVSCACSFEEGSKDTDEEMVYHHQLSFCRNNSSQLKMLPASPKIISLCGTVSWYTPSPPFTLGLDIWSMEFFVDNHQVHLQSSGLLDLQRRKLLYNYISISVSLTHIQNLVHRRRFTTHLLYTSNSIDVRLLICTINLIRLTRKNRKLLESNS